MAALALLATSCGDVKDSVSGATFREYNLITKLHPEAGDLAQVSPSSYNLELNWTQNNVILRTSDLSIGDNKVSFDTQAMPFSSYYLVSSDAQASFEIGQFSAAGNVGNGAKVTDVDAFFTPGVYVASGIYIPNVEVQSNPGARLILGYDLNDEYHVQTFWSACCYMGESVVSGGYTTSRTAYRVDLNFEKNTAKVVIYYPSLSSDDTDMPNAIVVDNIAIHFDSAGYYLDTQSPTTKVLGIEDGKAALVPADKYNVSNFVLNTKRTDLTEATITYRIDGKTVSFTGASIIKPSTSAS